LLVLLLLPPLLLLLLLPPSPLLVLHPPALLVLLLVLLLLCCINARQQAPTRAGTQSRSGFSSRGIVMMSRTAASMVPISSAVGATPGTSSMWVCGS
jgi:hypothetical protein